MTSLRVLISRLLDFFVKGRRERRLEEEISFHLELLAEENRKRGMSEREARAAARRSFGGVEQVKEVYRDRRGVPFVENLVQDLRFAFRLLKKERGFTVAAVLALTLGIGASNAVFTIVNVMVLRGLPHDEPDRIVKVRMRSETGSLPRVSYRDVQDWDAASNAFTHIAAFKNAFMTFGAEGRAEGRYRSTYVDAGTFGLLGEAPLLGRDFLPEDDRPGAAPVVILGHRVWTTHYEADPGVLGRTIEVDGTEATIIGVMKEDFRFPDFAELWQPLARLPGLDTDARDARTLRVVARLANDAERSSAQRQLDTVAGHLRETYPETNAGLTPRIEPFIGSATDFALFPALLGAVAFVLLIACANVANLLLARSATRSREIAVRAALGGTLWRILRQLMVESLVLAFTGAILGLGFSVLTLRLFARTIEGINLPYWLQWTMDERVVVFLVLATTTSVFAFGLVPALHLSRARLSTFIKEGRASRSPRTWMGALVVAELTFTLILLAAAGFMMRSFVALYQADRVVDTQELMSLRVSLPPERYETPEARVQFYQKLEERLAIVEPIASATIASALPFAGAPMRPLTIEGQPSETRPQPRVSIVSVGAHYFTTLGVGLVQGRVFTALDGTVGHDTAIVNQRFVSLHFPNQNPIGERVRAGDDDAPWLTIVGISPTVRQQSMGELDPVLYLPSRAEPSATGVLLVRGRGPVEALVREEVLALDPSLPVYGVVSMDELVRQSRWGHSVFGILFLLFAGIALVLSAVGLYAVVAYTVAERTHEIGVRLAFGARVPDILRLFGARVAAQVALGLALGMVGALAVGKLLERLLVQTSPAEPTLLAAVAFLLVAVSAAACLYPLRRAAISNPCNALRHE